MHETTTLLLVTLPTIHRLKNIFSHTLSNKPFLIWLLTTPPHLKYAATLPYNLTLMACFADINVSQGSVATYAGCGEIFNIHLTANLIRNLPLKKFVNRLRFDRIMMWQPAETCRNTVTAVACRVTHRLCQISPIIVCQGQACFGCWTDSVTDGSWAAHQNNWISCFDSKCLTARELKGERKCADTVGTVLVQKASGLAVSNAKNIFFKQNIRKQFYRTALGNCYALKLPKCWLQLKK